MKSVSRRDFFQGVSMGALGAGLASVAAVEAAAATVAGAGAGLPAADGQFRLGMVTYQMGKDMNCDALIDLCKQTGLAGVELRTTHAHKVEITLSKQERAEVQKKFSDANVIIAGLGSAFEFHSRNEKEVRKNIEGAKEYAQLAADVGAAGIKVRPNGVNDGEDQEKTFERIGKSWGELAAFAAGLGVEVRMEVHGGKESRNPANIRKMLDYANHPNAKVCWNCNGGEEDVNGSIKSNFDLLKHALGEVHINEIGIPKYPWQELFILLKEANYTGFCLAEIDYNPEPVRFMQYYRMLFDLYTGRYAYTPARG